MSDKIIVGIDELTALANAARDNLGETQLYTLDELTDVVSRASALPVDGIEGQLVSIGADGKPVWIDKSTIIPEATSPGQILVSDNDGTTVWEDKPEEEDADDALEMLVEMGILDPVTDEEGNILTDEEGNIFTVE